MSICMEALYRIGSELSEEVVIRDSRCIICQTNKDSEVL